MFVFGHVLYLRAKRQFGNNKFLRIVNKPLKTVNMSDAIAKQLEGFDNRLLVMTEAIELMDA